MTPGFKKLFVLALISAVNIIFMQLRLCFPLLCRCATEGSHKGLDSSNNKSVGNVDLTTVETTAEAPPVSAQPGSTSAPPEAQSSTVRSEVMPSSPVVILHVQSSPVHMQQSQQSAALSTQPSPPPTPSSSLTLTANLDTTRGMEDSKGVVSDPPSPVHQKKTHRNPVNNGNGVQHQDLVIEELQNSRDKSKTRAISIEVMFYFQLSLFVLLWYKYF